MNKNDGYRVDDLNSEVNMKNVLNKVLLLTKCVKTSSDISIIKDNLHSAEIDIEGALEDYKEENILYHVLYLIRAAKEQNDVEIIKDKMDAAENVIETYLEQEKNGIIKIYKSVCMLMSKMEDEVDDVDKLTFDLLGLRSFLNAVISEE